MKVKSKNLPQNDPITRQYKRAVEMRNFKHHKPGRGGWSEWVFPTHDENYLFKCCDCGLVHDMQFGAFAETNQKRGAFRVNKLPWPIRAMFRARRAR